MRLRLVLALFAATAIAWLLVRARGHESSLAASAVPVRESPSPEQAEREPGMTEAPALPLRRADADETRFEPLPEEPREIAVHLVDDATREPILGADVFVLEVDSEAWPYAGLAAGATTPDVEAELRARGRRIESDARGDLHLPIPRAYLAVMARKGELFGERLVGLADLPACTLSLHRSQPCTIRTRDAAGRPVAGARVELGCWRAEGFWGGNSDAAGELRVPNLGWLAGEHCLAEDPWYATINDACVAPPIRWFHRNEPPQVIELVLGAAQPLRLCIGASDGTRAPVNGFVNPDPGQSSGSNSRLSFRRRTFPSAALVRGEALVARAEPDSWLRVLVGFTSGEFFEDTLRVPAAGLNADPIALRMPERLQVVLLRPVDEHGAPLRAHEFDWSCWARSASGEFERSSPSVAVQSNEQGLLALVLARDEPAAQSVRYGLLHARCGELELESVPIPFAQFGPGALCDLGELRLAPAPPLARGRVLDERGLPLAHVSVGVEQLCAATQSDEAGAFAIRGACPGGTLSVTLSRFGYSLPPDSTQGLFECGSGPDLALTLVRNGAIRTSVRLTRALESPLTWMLESESDSRYLQVPPRKQPGLVENEFANIAPGRYVVRLLGGGLGHVPIFAAENVLVRAGERTLDPRLLAIEPLLQDPPSEAPIVLQVRDSNGREIEDGLLLEWFEDSHASEWHDGRVVVTNLREFSFAVWSPGFRAWFGPCPQRSGELRLEPAPMLRLRFRVPPELRQPGWRLLVTPRVTSATGVFDFADLLGPAELDSEDCVAFECPGECELELRLQLYALDPSGTRLREGSGPQDVTGFSLQMPGRDGVQQIPVTDEEWAAARKALDGER